MRAYTTTYAAVAFNGFPPLQQIVILTCCRTSGSLSLPGAISRCRIDGSPSAVRRNHRFSRLPARGGHSHDRDPRGACPRRPGARAPARRVLSRQPPCQDLGAPARSRRPARGLAFAAIRGGRLVGTLRLWHVEAGLARPALLLGPARRRSGDPGAGARLGDDAGGPSAGRRPSATAPCCWSATRPTYARFGFDRALAEGLTLPGPFERERFLGLELRAGALAGVEGMVRATGVQSPVGAVATRRGVARRRAA